MAALPPTPFRLHRLSQPRKKRVNSIQVPQSDTPSKSPLRNPPTKNRRLPVIPLEQQQRSPDRGHESFIDLKDNDYQERGDRTIPGHPVLLAASAGPVSDHGLCPFSSGWKLESGKTTLTHSGERLESQTTLTSPGRNYQWQTTLTSPGRTPERRTILTHSGERSERQTTLTSPGRKPERQTIMTHSGERSERQTTLTSPGQNLERQTTLTSPGQKTEKQTDSGETSERQTTLSSPGRKPEKQTTLTHSGERSERPTNLTGPGGNSERQTTSPRVWKSHTPGRGQGRRVSVEFTLPELPGRRRYPSFTEEIIAFPESNLIQEYSGETEHYDLEPVSLPTIERASTGTLSVMTTHQQGDNERERSSVTSCVTPLGREISEIIQSVRQKNDELLAVKAAVATINSKPKPAAEQESKDPDQVKLLKARSKRHPWKLPNTRYRCRTCFERLQDNVLYRQSLSMGAEQKTETDSKGWSGHRDGAKTFPRLPPKDLDGNVINASGKSAPAKANSWTKYSSVEKPRKGESRGGKNSSGANRSFRSRSRIEQLAEPKGGTKPRLKISGRVLRRQAEALRHPHGTSHLTARERERLLRLQSRVQLFLALLQERQMPSGMVHIPQRDDIMHVDISHIG